MPTISPVTVLAPADKSLPRTLTAKDAAAILSLAAGEIPEAGATEKAVTSNTLYNGYLKIFRGNPEALLDLFQKGQSLFNQPSINELLPEAAKNALAKIAKLMDSLLCSPKSLANPLFLKDYAARLGLSLESEWQKLVQQGSENQRPAESLKGLLLKLSIELKGLLKANETLDPEALQKLTHLAKFTEDAVRTIEAQQMINIRPQENDSKYLLQIPLLFPGGVRTGEIFIEERENGPGGEGKDKKFHVVMFLNMDQLGDLVVDASLSGSKVACVFKFSDPGAQEFFSPYLAGLGDALRQIGYDCDSLTSLLADDLPALRQDCHREMFYDQDAINLFA